MSDTATDRQRTRPRSGARRRLVLDRDNATVTTHDGQESYCFKQPGSVAGELSPEEHQLLCIALFRLYQRPELRLKEAFHHCSLDGHLVERDRERAVRRNDHYVLIPTRCRCCNVRYYDVYRREQGGGERDG